jgi:hypothetical protein
MMTSTADSALRSGAHHIGVLRLLVTGGLTGLAIFVLCWLGTLVPFSSPTHAYISLFTTAEIGSGRALLEGSIWSLLFGGLAAAVFAVTYNSTAALSRP